jgi:hypothetical protein
MNSFSEARVAAVCTSLAHRALGWGNGRWGLCAHGRIENRLQKISQHTFHIILDHMAHRRTRIPQQNQRGQKNLTQTTWVRCAPVFANAPARIHQGRVAGACVHALPWFRLHARAPWSAHKRRPNLTMWIEFKGSPQQKLLFRKYERQRKAQTHGHQCTHKLAFKHTCI